MSWVVDASFAATLFLPDEHTETSDAFFDTVSNQNLVFVPHLWWSEMNNILVTATRRQRLSAQKSREVLFLLEQLPLTTVDILSHQLILDIATKHQLSAYDATYLVTALEQKSGLVSFDHALIKAAQSLGVAVI